MRLTSFILTVFALLSVGISALPLAIPQAVAVAVAQPEAEAVAFRIIAEKSKPATAALPAGNTLSFKAVVQNLAQVNNDLVVLTKTLSATGLPDGILAQVLNVVVSFIRGLSTCIISKKSPDSINSSIDSLLTTTIGALDKIAQTEGSKDGVGRLLTRVIASVESSLTDIVETITISLASVRSLNAMQTLETILTGGRKVLSNILDFL